MAKSVKKRYFVLGEKASIFYDPYTQLKVVSKTEPTTLEKPVSKRVKLALDQKHIVEVESAKPIESKNSEESKEKGNTLTAEAFDSLSDEELVKNHTVADFKQFYKDTYEVTEEDMKKFSSLKKDEMVTFLRDDEDAE